MQYAEIIVNHPGGYKPWTYSIPPEMLADIAVGSIVNVPVFKATSSGVVVAFRRHIPSDVSAVKPIAKIIYKGEFVDSRIVKLATDLAAKRGMAVGPVLFKFLPPESKRPQAFIKPTEATINLPISRPNILLGPANSRVGKYKQLVDHSLKQDKSVIICTSSIPSSVALAQALSEFSPIVFDSSNGARQERILYHKLLTEPKNVIIGTRSVLNLPMTHVGQIIIDEPFLPGQKDDQNGKFWSYEIGFGINHIFATPLTFGSTVPLIDDMRFLQLETKTLESSVTELSFVEQARLTDQLADILSRYDKGQTIAVVVKEQKQSGTWCKKCSRFDLGNKPNCSVCRNSVIQLPQVTIDTLRKSLNPNGQVTFIRTEEIPNFAQHDVVIGVSFDAYNYINDYRGDWFRLLMYQSLQNMARTNCVIISRDTEKIANIFTLASRENIENELISRRNENLSPYRQLVKITVRTPYAWKKLKTEIPAPAIIIGTYRKQENRILLLSLPLTLRLPETWSRISGLVVDLSPNYVE